MNLRNSIFSSVFAISMIFGLTACNENDSDTKQNTKQEQIAMQANEQVGMPAITNFFEKRMLKQIYELRDDPNYRTITYLPDMYGHLHFICNSIGYGIPGATQYTNPQKAVMGYREYLTIPQADPNALFSPASADATWVMCVDPGESNPQKAIKATYLEPRVIVSAYPLDVK